MIDGILHPLNIFVGILVFASGVFSIYANVKKASKKDVVSFGKAVENEINKLKQQNAAQQQLIDTLQKQNDLEDQIIEEQYPNIEETMALLARGQSVILEKLEELEGGENNDKSSG